MTDSCFRRRAKFISIRVRTGKTPEENISTTGGEGSLTLELPAGLPRGNKLYSSMSFFKPVSKHHLSLTQPLEFIRDKLFVLKTKRKKKKDRACSFSSVYVLLSQLIKLSRRKHTLLK
ncbi:hypothetical protein CHARACLAT_003561 [Characodon lateralis]|uniref:Uncharacterized protein n=1 Tax=Characodon lateralis TaxID=208331 RepID=A0ABU7CWF3_9TELE|nr:hypothetical protein [Characodon lateralis]